MGPSRMLRVGSCLLVAQSLPLTVSANDDIVFTGQVRTIAGVVTAESVRGTDVDAGADAAKGFGSWNANIDLIANAPGTGSNVSGSVFQYSSLTPSLISLSGGGYFFMTACAAPCLSLEADLQSSAEVTFVAPTSFRLVVAGHLGLSEPPQCDEGGLATVLLTGPKGVVLQKATTNLLNIIHSESLPAGEYSLSSTAGPAATLFCPDFGETIFWIKAYFTPCPGDLNASGNADAADIALLLGAWGSGDAQSDVDGSGTVDAGDLAIVLGDWGPCDSGNPCLDSGHDCFTVGPPGCVDIVCCQAVCEVDGFCCEVAWDSICVDEAGFFCGVP